MGLRFCSFASGSTGNCYLVRSDDTALLVDCGISGKRIVESLGACGLGPDDLNAILITHEHTDHVQSVRVMSRKASGAGIYATRGTIKAISDNIQAGIIHITLVDQFNAGAHFCDHFLDIFHRHEI